MAIAFVGVANNQQPAGVSNTCNAPSQTVGHLLLSYVVPFDNNSNVITAPDGTWTEIGAAFVAITSAAEIMFGRVYYKLLTAAGAASYTWTVSTSAFYDVYQVAYSGVASVIQDTTATANSGTTATRTALGLTATRPGVRLVAFTTGYTANTTTFGGMTLRGNYVFDEALAAGGATGDRTSANAADTWIASMVALRPATARKMTPMRGIY
jgi:hypothetical protein